MLFLHLLAVALAADASDRVGWGGGALPAPSYSSDEGLGMGAVGSFYRYDGTTAPYRSAVTLLTWGTTRGVHAHSIEADLLSFLDPRLRVTAEMELNVTSTGNYCGVGNAVTCAEGESERYLQTRFVNPVGRLDARWRLDPMPHRVELLAGGRVSAVRPGDLRARTPYPNTLYAADHPDGESGQMSVLQVGVMVDDRDHEPAPTRGHWTEATVRGASPVWGSTLGYVGFNVTVRTYLALGTEALVLANRVLVDGMAGEATTLELATPGGTQRMKFFGDYTAGRGIRQSRFLGKWKAMEQVELRWTFAHPKVASIPLDLGVLGFSDLGFVGADASEVGTMFRTPLPTAGGGLRVTVDDTFIVRVDTGVSPVERYEPYVYIDLGNVF